MRGRAKVFYFISMHRLIKNLISSLAVVILTAGVAVARQPAEADDALLAKLKTRDHRIRDVAFSPDGKLLAAGYGFSDEGGITIWNVADRSVVVNLLAGPKQTVAVPRIAFSPDGKLFAAATDKGDVMVWTVGQWRSPKTVLRQRGSPADLTFGGAMLGFASEEEALLYHLATSEVIVLATRSGPGDSFTEISFTRDGKLAAVSGHRKTFLWNVETRQRLDSLDLAAFGFFGSLSPTGSHFILGGGPVFGKKSVQIWNVPEKKLLTELRDFRGGIFSLGISHSGSLFALAGGNYGRGGGDLSLWSVDDGREIAYTRFGDAPIHSLAFSPDDATLAGGSEDGFVLLYAVDRLKGPVVTKQTSALCGEIAVEGNRAFIRSLSMVPLPMRDFGYPWRTEITNSDAVAAFAGSPVILNEWFIESTAATDRARVAAFRSLLDDPLRPNPDHIVFGYTQNPGWSDGFVAKLYSDGRFVAANTLGECLSAGSLADLKTNFAAVRDRLISRGIIDVQKEPLTLGADHYGTAFIEFTINGVPELRSDADDIAVLLNGGPAKKREAFSRIFKQEQAFVDSILKAGMKLPGVAGK